ncbi:EF-P 5-aminopentanol modification-associated protein YfmH [Erysipelothrix sp. HDW6C]|uniref:EF-P 5-aminopentanol modification-associated protein YfmH n=1 Tax=Erysipelothrix sp. HDW6C TaxID=2714930 RepID=UPI001F0F6E28|nr:pitrilysin family protein [Erysipelothrix sp. HDW6C]
MKKIDNAFKEAVYTFNTKSNLTVYIVHRPGFKRSSAVYGTPFGALNLKQNVNGDLIEHKSGVAHFLEHKLFEDPTRDVLSQFSDMGANGNAFTSYDQTMYYFGHNGPIAEPLKLLINFVSRFAVTAESVEKEKGIIVEEVKMYEQMPHMRLLNETYRSVFHAYPYIYDIAGTEESVNATTLEDLKRAYELNYSDHRMVLVVVSPEDPQSIHDLIVAETEGHTNSTDVVEDVFDPEEMSVVDRYREISDNVETPKMSLSYKLPYWGDNKQKDDFLISMLLEMNFSELNEDFQSWLDTDLVSNGFSFGTEVRDEFVLITFINEGEQTERFHLVIDEVMNSLQVDEMKFQQLANRYYGEMIMSLAKTDELAITIARAHFDGMNYFEYLEMIQNLKFDDIKMVMNKINTDNSSFLVMKKKD